jgi:hypothetical protein
MEEFNRLTRRLWNEDSGSIIGVVLSMAMTYDFLIDAYETERLKVLSVWSEFTTTIFPFGRGR